MNGLYLQQLKAFEARSLTVKAFQLLLTFLFKNCCEILFLMPLKGTAEWQLKCLLNTILRELARTDEDHPRLL